VGEEKTVVPSICRSWDLFQSFELNPPSLLSQGGTSDISREEIAKYALRKEGLFCIFHRKILIFEVFFVQSESSMSPQKSGDFMGKRRNPRIL
jgi:hypothetical protein